MTRILFVCLGNICRSPTAEGAFRRAVEKRGLEELVEIDSAGSVDFRDGSITLASGGRWRSTLASAPCCATAR